MRVPLAEVGRRGRLDLRFGLENGRTILRHSYCETPFKITRPNTVRTPGQAHLILMQCTAGLFGGDNVTTAIHVESGARVRLTQQSATKIHPSEGRPAFQDTRIVVEPDAELQMFLEPAIPFAGSRLHQTTWIDVAPGGRLAYWEGFMAGRVGKGEQWQFDELASETRLESAGNLLYLDRFAVHPGADQPTSALAVDSNPYIGTGLFFGNDSELCTQTLHDSLPASGVDTPAPGLVVVRTVAATGPLFHGYRERFEAEIRTVLLVPQFRSTTGS